MAKKRAKKTEPGIFSEETFTFLRGLKRNNNRAWFEKNRERFEKDAKEPMLELIRAAGPALREVSKHFVADPRPVGGSMFRIYRDTRFSKDKTPYKTHLGAHFRHDAGKDVHAPGFYFHVEPGSVFLAAGLWRPETADAQKIRRAIAANGATWKKIVGAKSFRARCELDGESLARPPRGFDPKHPLIEDLKRKDFVATAALSEKIACSAELPAAFREAALAMAPLVEFLTLACGHRF